METGKTFSQALDAIKQGKCAGRAGWNGKNQYIALAMDIQFTDHEGKQVKPAHATMGNNAIAFYGTSGIQVGWLASQADMLANDWEILD